MIEIKHKDTGKVLYVVKADTLSGAKLNDAKLNGANLRDADLSHANLTSADLNRADLSHANLTSADLTGAYLNYAHLSGAHLTGTDLSHADLTSADLTGAYLNHANLSSADLTGAYLSYIDLSHANLTSADLNRAYLSHADLAEAHLTGANLTGADLSHADLTEAHLTGANLIGVDLSHAYLRNCNLRNVDLSRAMLWNTIFLNCNTLHVAKGLDTVNHEGSSSLDAHTLRASIEHLPDIFLRGVGYTDHEIGYLRALYIEKVVRYYSCFISYSGENIEFATRLHSRLNQANILNWYAPHDMKSGQIMIEQIDHAIRHHDRLLLVLSEESIRSEWVITEIRKARKAEKDGKRKLFPISITDWQNIKNWECFDADTGTDLAAEIRKFYIPDFSNWKSHDALEAEFQKLLKSFQADQKQS